MREQLINYVNLLFAGTTDTEEIKQEILVNTLDRYDDLVAQGKSPEAAYRLAMTGIGDIDEILAREKPVVNQPETITYAEPIAQPSPDEKEKKTRRAAAIAMYICCPVPLFILGDTLGLCLMLILIAAATALLVMNGDKDEEVREAHSTNHNGRSESAKSLIKTIKKFNTLISITVFLVLSFVTGAWYITWMVFPLFSCINGLIAACIDLKEAK
jgi:hypothetical protein